MELADMHAYGLNPFEIRAGQKPLRTWLLTTAAVLIPLKSGQARNGKVAGYWTPLEGLNPFEIRAGQKRYKAASRKTCVPS